MNWYVSDGTWIAGPFPAEQLQQMAAVGQLRPEMSVRQGETGGWFYAAQVPGLFAAAQPAATPLSYAAEPAGRQVGVATCGLCGSTVMRRRSIYRLDAPMVAIGWMFLIPGYLGILLAVGFYWAATLGMVEVPQAVAPRDRADQQPREIVRLNRATIDALLTLRVPAEITTKLRSGQRVTEAEIARLTPPQAELVRGLNRQLGSEPPPEPAAADPPPEFLVRLQTVATPLILLAALVAVAVGWLLTMKKRVIQCLQCRALVEAG